MTLNNLAIAAEKKPATLRELLSEAAGWDAALSAVPVKPCDLHFEAEGIRHSGEFLQVDQSSRSRLFEKVGAPISYWEHHTPRFQAAALSEHVTRGDFGTAPMLVLRAGEFVTIARGELFALPNHDVFRAVEEAVGTEGEGLSVARIGLNDECVDVDLISPSRAITVRRGDIVQSGLHIVHHRFGDQATLIEAFIYRLVCSNGMTRRECVNGGPARTRKLRVGFPNNRELQMNQVRRLTRQTWNTLGTQLNALRSTSERPAHVEELLTQWLQRARMSARTMMARLLAAWREEGSEDTYYGAVNALTRVATHHLDLSNRQRRMLASLAGLLAFSEVHICPRCFSVLGGSSDDRHSGADQHDNNLPAESLT
jgi:hypothetical protein